MSKSTKKKLLLSMTKAEIIEMVLELYSARKEAKEYLEFYAILLSKHYFNGCLLRRNDYMLSHSCGLIAFFDGKPKGGTFYTCRKAKSMGMDIINLYKTQV